MTKKITILFAQIGAIVGLILIGWNIILALENKVIGDIYFSFEALYFGSGWISFGLLFMGLFVPKPLGKILGFLSFVAALLHIGIFMDLDFTWEWALAFDKILNEKPLIYGAIGFVGMVLVFIISLCGLFNFLKANLLVYVIIVCSLWHILSLKKVFNTWYYLILLVVLFNVAFKLGRFLRAKI